MVKKTFDKMPQKIMVVHSVSDGVWGDPILIVAMVCNGDNIVEMIILKLAEDSVTNKWTRENILPEIQDIKTTHVTQLGMLREFSGFYKKYMEDYKLVWHLGHKSICNIFRRMFYCSVIDVDQGPCAPIELATMLHSVGEEYETLVPYIEKNNLKINSFGKKNKIFNPLYECDAIVKTYYSLINKECANE